MCVAELRAIYDRYGEYGLKEGVMIEGKRVGGGYFLKVQPEVVFDQVFNSTDPWADQHNLDGGDYRGSMFGDGFKGLNQQANAVPGDVCVQIECTLAEFYCGCQRQICYTIDEVQHDGKSVAKKEMKKMVQVDPGFSEKTVLTFKGMGNQVPKQQSSNLVVTFAQVANEEFRRSGDDLILTHAVSFEDTLRLKPVHVKTLDGRNLTLGFDELISPQTVRIVKGEGMPQAAPEDDKDAKPTKLMDLSQMPKGDLYIRFAISFPKQLSNAQRQKIIQTLKANADELA